MQSLWFHGEDHAKREGPMGKKEGPIGKKEGPTARKGRTKVEMGETKDPTLLRRVLLAVTNYP
jgi:hypothetical protein